MSVSIQTDEYEAHVLKCNANNRIKTCSGELDGSIKAPSAALHIFCNRHLYLCICTRLFKVLEWSISLQNLRESLLLKKKYSASTKALLYSQRRVRLQTILALAQGFSQCREWFASPLCIDWYWSDETIALQGHSQGFVARRAMELYSNEHAGIQVL